MVVFWKVIIAVFLLCIIVTDGNRARRQRRQMPPNPSANSMNPQGQPSNPHMVNGPGRSFPQQGRQNDLPQGKQGSRQYYSPYQGQSGYGSVQGLNYPFAGAGVGSYQYGTGQYGQYGSGGGYGNYYNQYPSYGSNSGYGGGSYSNRPYGSGGYGGGYGGGGYGGGGYGGSGYGGGYFWNSGHKQNMNIFTVFLSSLLTLVICLTV